MVDKISVEIGLEGGEQVSQQLEQIGKSGEKAFSDIQGAADQINLNSAAGQFDDLGNTGQAAFQKIQTAASGAVAFEQVIQGVKKVEGSFEALGTAATKMATRMTRSLGVFGVLARSLGPVGIAVGVLGGLIVKFGNDSAEALGKLTTEGAKLGLTAQQFDQLGQTFAKLGVAPEAFTAGLDKLKNLLGGGGLLRLGDIVPPDATDGIKQFIAQLEAMPDSVQRTQLAMQTLGNELGGAVIAGLQTGTISAQNFATALGQVSPATQQQIKDANQYNQTLNLLSAAWTELKRTFAPITTSVFSFLTTEIKNFQKDIENLINQIRFLKAIWDVFAAAMSGKDIGVAARKAAEEYKKATEAAKEANQGFGQAVAPIQDTANAANTATAALDQTGQAGETAGQKIKRGMEEAAEASRLAAAEAARLAALFFSPGYNVAGAQQTAGALRYFNAQGMAQGGLLGGHGTGTSDSNLAWVSRGEYITPARAVAQPGVLGFLEALRRSGGNLSRVLDGMGRFALGGLVPRMPSFATGGLAGGSNVTIQFPGLPAIGGLRASATVVDQLHRAAALAQVRSGGRKPSRYS